MKAKSLILMSNDDETLKSGMVVPKEDPYKATRVGGAGRLMVPSEMGFTPIPPEPEPIKPPPKRVPSTLQEWQKQNPGMVTKSSEPSQSEKDWQEMKRAKGKGRTALEDWKAAQEILERSDSPDEFVGFGEDGKPIWRRRATGGDVKRPTGIPPSGDGVVDTAMDIYRGADNYPRDKPIDVQQGFAVAASTQDYNRQKYSTEAPVAAQIVKYDGREGEVREYDDGSRFFVSLEGDGVILRMKDRK